MYYANFKPKLPGATGRLNLIYSCGAMVVNSWGIGIKKRVKAGEDQIPWFKDGNRWGQVSYMGLS
jgi:hypothetical protein